MHLQCRLITLVPANPCAGCRRWDAACSSPFMPTCPPSAAASLSNSVPTLPPSNSCWVLGRYAKWLLERADGGQRTELDRWAGWWVGGQARQARQGVCLCLHVPGWQRTADSPPPWSVWCSVMAGMCERCLDHNRRVQVGICCDVLPVGALERVLWATWLAPGPSWRQFGGAAAASACRLPPPHLPPAYLIPLLPFVLVLAAPAGGGLWRAGHVSGGGGA